MAPIDTSPLSGERIRQLLEALNGELKADGVRGRLHLAGGAVMCLAFAARESTQDVDASFQPSVKVLEAAHRVAAREGIKESWLNNAVEGYLSDRGTYAPLMELSHLDVLSATPEYMLAMKCLAMRLGEGYQDEEDVRYLLRNLGLRSHEEAEEILGRYYPLEEFPETARLALRELLPG